ncbi:hypothetical protein VFPPC_17151 [Pochonia chlamydosporia 170]|uniref:Uncharacterized protein n=1 Tax=Pochonia chlamydosporia 170 TaxID=1380566 RepID=A0A179EWM9_METCM|nr:hypothetical protein VFPPC_17151 [Pochonia chlamydosporia 170]OAQ57562.1 hypothetical protein VFPPC_17151 [Pochonia chlamydosporia 170]
MFLLAKLESKIQEAVEHIERFPSAKITTVSIQSPRLQKGGHCAAVHRLDRINLVVRPELVTEAANYILREPTPLAERDDPPVVGLNCTAQVR